MLVVTFTFSKQIRDPRITAVWKNIWNSNNNNTAEQFTFASPVKRVCVCV